MDKIYTASKASFFCKADEDIANTLVATDYKDPPLICPADCIQFLVDDPDEEEE